MHIRKLGEMVFVFGLTFPEVACQPNSGMAVSVACVSDIGIWLKGVGRD